MSWSRRERRHFPLPPDHIGRSAHVGVNRRCFIRKEHECGKMFAASKSCFIACPTDENLEPLLELMSEKLAKHGIEPIIAVKERAYGQDIFCTKICGKIIEARFCAVILDDSLRDGSGIPNPNVYYEYGLMTSLGKHIIPLQREDQALAFNIQSYDTIKYNPRNMASELERAIRDAIQLTSSENTSQVQLGLPDKTILRRLELAGFVEGDNQWYLAAVAGDTLFRGFSGPDRVLFLGRLDSDDDLRPHLEDLDIVLHRTEKRVMELEAESTALSERIREIEETKGKAPLTQLSYTSLFDFSLDRAPKDLYEETRSKLARLRIVFVAFVVAPGVDAADFANRAIEAAAPYPRFTICLSSGGQLALGPSNIDLNVPT